MPASLAGADVLESWPSAGLATGHLQQHSEVIYLHWFWLRKAGMCQAWTPRVWQALSLVLKDSVLQVEVPGPSSSCSWLPGGFQPWASMSSPRPHPREREVLAPGWEGYQAAAAMRNWATERSEGPVSDLLRGRLLAALLLPSLVT